MRTDAWKAHERAIAKRLGGKRAGPTGRRNSDVLLPLLAVECKERATPTLWLEAALNQSQTAAQSDQIPIVIIHWKGQRHDRDIVMLRLTDFEDLHGDTNKPTP